MVADGKGIAQRLYQELEKERASIARPLSLGVITCGADAVTESFLRIKARVASRLSIAIVRRDVPEAAGTEVLIDAVKALAAETDAVIVQLPLPKGVDADLVLAAIPNSKDADALNPATPDNEREVHAPVALAAVEILRASGIGIEGKRAAVIGAGRLVGAPAAALLCKEGAAVSVITLEEGSLSDLKDADIVVSGAGRSGLITPDLLKEGVALIDAGTSESGGKVVGDADPACALRASVFTPTPGGVGPVAIAMLFRNVLTLAQKA